MSLSNFVVPLSVLTDSYKAGHFHQYPDAQTMVAYGEFRAGYDKDKEDTRFVFYGIRYIVENYISKQWTIKDVELADKFYSTHNAGKTPYPFPKELFLKFVNENNGYFPVRLQALREGTVANARTPVYQITAKGDYSKLITFLETILTQVWYPSTVATLSRRSRDLFEDAFEKSVDKELNWLLDSRLHDFGFRGCTCVEQSIIGGCAHLLNFTGTDTMSAAFYAQYHLNDGNPVGESVPATEHSVMTSWSNEGDAIRNMINHNAGEGKLFATVMDSYDYENALDKVVPAMLPEKLAKDNGKGVWILRPDSGDPTDSVLKGLRAADKAAGHTLNSKGFKVIKGINVIQGDGVDYKEIKKVLAAVLAEGYAAQNVAFGMGGGLLQKVNRDTMSFATKLSYIKYADGTVRQVMKCPKTDASKISFPGPLKVKLVNGVPTVFPAKEDEVDPEDLLVTVYNNGPVDGFKWDTFTTLKQKVKESWPKVPKSFNPISAELQVDIDAWVKDYKENYLKKILGSQ